MTEHGFVVPSLLLPSEGGTEYGREEDESRNRSVRKVNLKLQKIERSQTKTGTRPHNSAILTEWHRRTDCLRTKYEIRCNALWLSTSQRG